MNESDRKLRFRIRNVLFALAVLIVVLCGLEGFFRLLGIGEKPPADLRKLDVKHSVGDFVGSLEIFANMQLREGGRSFYVEDPEMLWKLRPNFKGKARDLFTTPFSDMAQEWSFSMNSYGFRGPDFNINREPGVYRIVALGDSTTFGFGVDPGQTYPERLQAELGGICPSCRFEVINLGLPGYSSEQGRIIAKKWIPLLNPQAVTISYGTSDWWKREKSDRDEMARLKTRRARIERFLRKSALIKGVMALFAGGSNGMKKSSDNSMAPRVSEDRYRENIEEITKIAQGSGAKVILVDNNFYVPFGTESLMRIFGEHPDFALVDSVGILAASLQNPDELKKKYPLSASMALRHYSRVIYRRPMFLVMVDPINPNPVGHEIIAEALADVIMGRGSVADSLAEKLRIEKTLPPLKALGGGFLERTALEARTSKTEKK